MIWIVSLPFAAVVIAICAVRLMRRIAESAEIRSQASQNFDVGRPKPSDEFHDEIWLPLCTNVAAISAERLNRALTQAERRKIWRARSVLVLEVAMKEVQVLSDGTAVTELLVSFPSGIDRPDRTGWCGG